MPPEEVCFPLINSTLLQLPRIDCNFSLIGVEFWLSTPDYAHFINNDFLELDAGKIVEEVILLPKTRGFCFCPLRPDPAFPHKSIVG
mmetsp:Transcript_29588/g.33669  ORF Transcript_29588/g.33669 Transcript_29588/m.33669 type:complete len:87 (+) Transcript_29588:432-692(+)